MHQITPFFWLHGNAEEAMNYYVETFPNSKITHIERYAGDQGIPGEQEFAGKVLTGVFELNGQKFMCLDGGSEMEIGGGISFLIEFDEQAELNTVWERLLDGGTPQQCGWITDKFGITWQITPTVLGKLMSDPAGTAAQKQAVMQAMMPMVKLEAAPLEAAFEAAK